jgi:hypothetical protein
MGARGLGEATLRASACYTSLTCTIGLFRAWLKRRRPSFEACESKARGTHQVRHERCSSTIPHASKES